MAIAATDLATRMRVLSDAVRRSLAGGQSVETPAASSGKPARAGKPKKAATE